MNSNTIEYASDPKSRLSRMAVMSFVVALVGLPYWPAWILESEIYELGRIFPGSSDLIAILATLLWTGACIAFLIVALRRIIGSNGLLRGKGLVYAAMAVEGMWILITIVITVVLWDADLH
jgi:hypothetical protein